MEEKQALIKRESVQIMPIIPKNYDEVFKMGKMMAHTDMVPKDFKGHEPNTIVAIQLGMEVGLLPMQALQNIAVINGRPCIWGDAQIALVRGSGHLEWMKETGDLNSATCEVKRYDEPNVVSQTFSKTDAQTAGLWGKTGPWKQYPKRMLQMRARSFALRDLFPDVLKGIQSREEVQDIIDIEAVIVTEKEKEKDKEKFEASKKILDAQKPPMEILTADEITNPPVVEEPEETPPPAPGPGIADENAIPPPMDDDIPITLETINEEQIATVLQKVRDLKLTTKEFVTFAKKNGFSDASKITQERYDLFLEGLEEIAK